MKKRNKLIYLLVFMLVFSGLSPVKALDYDSIHEENNIDVLLYPPSWYRASTKSPLIVDYKVNKTSLKKNDSLEINLKLKEKAQINHKNIDLIYENTISKNTVIFSAMSKDGLNYRARTKIVGNKYENGSYVFKGVRNRDFKGNKIVLAKGVKPAKLNLKNFSQPIKSAQLLSFKTSQVLGDKNKVSLEARLDRPMDNKSSLSLNLVNTKSDWPMKVELVRDKSDGKLFRAEITLEDYSDDYPVNGSYRLDKDPESIWLSNGKGKKINVFPSKNILAENLEIKSTIAEKNSSTYIKSVKLKKNKLKRGEVLDMTINLNQKEALGAIFAYYEAPKTKSLYMLKIYGVGNTGDSFNFRYYLQGYMEPGTYKCVGYEGDYSNGRKVRLGDKASFPDFTIAKDNNRKIFPDLYDDRIPEAKMLKTYVAKKNIGVKDIYNDKQIASLKTGEKVRGLAYNIYGEDELIIAKDDKFCRVGKKHLNLYGARVNFISRGANVRDAKGKKVAYLKAGSRVKAKDLGNKIEFNLKGKKVYVPKKFVEEDGISRTYVSRGVNVRDLKGRKLGYLSNNKKIYGKRNGSYIEITYKNKKAKIHSKYVN